MTGKALDGFRYTARFSAEAWIRDQAVPVDPYGPTTWDCTEAIRSDQAYFEWLVSGDLSQYDWPGGVVDNDDVLFTDPNAPPWTRSWGGPFTIWVSRSPV